MVQWLPDCIDNKAIYFMAKLKKPCELKLPKSDVDCPMDALLKLIMGRWTTYILWVLCCQGQKRFGELKRAVPGVSTKVLTERLKMLTKAGVIMRHYQETIPPTVTYSISPRGRELTGVLNNLKDLACQWNEENKDEQLSLV